MTISDKQSLVNPSMTGGRNDVAAEKLPLMTVIIPVRNRTESLRVCLKCLELQEAPPLFEVIVVDDGSSSDVLSEFARLTFPFDFVVARQSAMGISAARNYGTNLAKSDILVYIDSDCEVEPSFISNLYDFIKQTPKDLAYQCALSSKNDNTVHRYEGLRLLAIQRQSMQPNGYIRYLNTSGFALRRSFTLTQPPFDCSFLRGEDTAVLKRLIDGGHLPRYAETARVIHVPVMSTWKYVTKNYSIGYYTGPSRSIFSKSAKPFMSTGGKLNIFRCMFGEAVRLKYNAAWYGFLICCSYILVVLGRAAYKIFGIRPGSTTLSGFRFDIVSTREIAARLLEAIHRRRPFFVTSLDQQALINNSRDQAYAAILSEFEVVYVEGTGAKRALFVTRGRLTHEVKLNELMMMISQDASRRGISMALIGGDSNETQQIIARLNAQGVSPKVVYDHHGQFNESEEDAIIFDLVRAAPGLIILGMKQPRQEQFANKIRKSMANVACLCTGSFFNSLASQTDVH